MKLQTFKRAELLINDINKIKSKLEKIKSYHKNKPLDAELEYICEVAYESLFNLKMIKEKEFENL